MSLEEVIKMQQMFDAGCSPGMYQMQGKSYSFPDLSTTLCPKCQGDFMRKHGFYERTIVEVGFEGLIVIRRYICPECGKTVSLLPSFCHPGRIYSVLVIVGVLTEYYVKMQRVREAVTNFFVMTEVACSRQLLRHYRLRVEENLKRLVMSMMDIYRLKKPLVRSTGVRERVRQLLSFIKSPQNESLKIFKHTGTTYLSPQPN
jgi:ribosomal protein S27AE